MRLRATLLVRTTIFLSYKKICVCARESDLIKTVDGDLDGFPGRACRKWVKLMVFYRKIGVVHRAITRLLWGFDFTLTMEGSSFSDSFCSYH